MFEYCQCAYILHNTAPDTAFNRKVWMSNLLDQLDKTFLNLDLKDDFSYLNFISWFERLFFILEL
jgi:hypothetical protein